jgi:hypothetical protein
MTIEQLKSFIAQNNLHLESLKLDNQKFISVVSQLEVWFLLRFFLNLIFNIYNLEVS